MLLKFEDALNKIEGWFMIIGIAAMGVIMTLEVFFRLFFFALTWSEELAKYIFVWVVFIGMCYGIGKGLHIRMELLEEKMPPVIKKLMLIVGDIILILLFIYLLGPSWEYFVSQCSQKVATIPIHMGYVTIVVPISFVLCLIQIALDIVKQVKGEK